MRGAPSFISEALVYVAKARVDRHLQVTDLYISLNRRVIIGYVQYFCTSLSMTYIGSDVLCRTCEEWN